MFKLAHISDLHLRPLPRIGIGQLLSKRITGYLNWKLNRRHILDPDYLDRLIADLKAHKPDHTVITGDLVNLALEKEFSNARAFLENFAPADRATVLFGNHDAYVPGALSRAIQEWQAYASSDNASLESPSGFPVLRLRGDIAIIACNSAEATMPFMATGYFRQTQAERLSALLDETRGKCRVVCIHHPPLADITPHHKRLVGAELFQQVVAHHGAELILHGHTHEANSNTLPGPEGIIPVIGVPAAGNAHGNSRPGGRYNLFSIEQKGKGWKIRWTARTCTPGSQSVETVEQREL